MEYLNPNNIIETHSIWIIRNPQVAQPQISNDCHKLPIGDHAKIKLAPKTYYTCLSKKFIISC